MPAIINFLQQTGFYMFGQDGNGKCLIMIAISFILMYLAIVKGFEPLLLLPISFGMLCTNLPGADMFHEILFAGGHVHWDLFGGTPVTASFIAEMSESGVSDAVLAPYFQQLLASAQEAFGADTIQQVASEVMAAAGGTISEFTAQAQAVAQAEQAAAVYGMELAGPTVNLGLLDVLYLGVKLGIYPCLIFMGVGSMTDFGPLIANPKSLLLGAAAQLGIFMTYVGTQLLGFTSQESSSIGIIGGADGPTAIFVTTRLAPHLLGPIAVAAYSYMALVPVIQPPIMKALTTKEDCEAREAGAFLAAVARAHQDTDCSLAFLAGGETVVHLTGKGLGGRNQELALAAAPALAGLKHCCVFSVGSDGTDGPTDAAGGYVDGETEAALRAAGRDVYRTLADNDAYHALQAVGGLIMTGPTGTNVNDVAVVLAE